MSGVNGTPEEGTWHPKARALWATINKLPPGHKIISDHEMMVMANAMNGMTALNEAFKSDFRARNRADEQYLARLVTILWGLLAAVEKAKTVSEPLAQAIHVEFMRLKDTVARLEDQILAQNGRAKDGKR